jgi:hypothetical protein
MRSRSEIWLSALKELGAQCSVDTTRDALTVARRVEHEGDTFFKVTLPQFGKDLERSLSNEGIPIDAFCGWARRDHMVTVVWTDDDDPDWRGVKHKKYRHGLPKFVGGFMDRVVRDV